MGQSTSESVLEESNILGEIKKFSPEKMKAFYDTLDDYLTEPSRCRELGVNPERPDRNLAAIRLYRQIS